MSYSISNVIPWPLVLEQKNINEKIRFSMFLQASFLCWMCVWKQNLETLSAKPQLDPTVLPIQNGDPYTVPPMLLPYGHRVSLLGGHPYTSVRRWHTRWRRGCPRADHWRWHNVFLCSTCENSLPFHFLTLKRVISVHVVGCQGTS